MAEIMSPALRTQLAHRLGVAHLVVGDYWGNVPARECGALVREAIRLAEQAMAGPMPGPVPAGQPASGMVPGAVSGAPARGLAFRP